MSAPTPITSPDAARDSTIAQLVAAAPALTDAQRARIALALKAGAR